MDFANHLIKYISNLQIGNQIKEQFILIAKGDCFNYRVCCVAFAVDILHRYLKNSKDILEPSMITFTDSCFANPYL